jgi:aminoglycoside 3-N-acetyltransferase
VRPWSRDDLVRALRSVRIGPGDVVYFQVCHETLGPAEGATTDAELSRLMYAALLEVVGPTGTILAPSYTFSFCRQEVFDTIETPTVVGPWNTFTAFPEFLRRLPGAVRSCDPIF